MRARDRRIQYAALPPCQFPAHDLFLVNINTDTQTYLLFWGGRGAGPEKLYKSPGLPSSFNSSTLKMLVIHPQSSRPTTTIPSSSPSFPVQRFVHKGVPNPMRRQIWMRNCPPRGKPAHEKVPESVVDAIKLDLPRTFPDNEFVRTEK